MRFLTKFQLKYWPILSCCWFVNSFIITYIISICNGHVYPFFPYISDTGTKPPESCIFAQLLNIGAVLLGITIYIRYKQIEIVIRCTNNVIRSSWNIASMLLGFLSCLGITIVANFQETNLIEVHLIGASLVFWIGLLYIGTQVRITLSFGNLTHSEHRVKRWLVNIRLLMISCLVPLSFITPICGYISVRQFTGENIEYWTEEDGGFSIRLVGTFSEWSAVVLMMFFMMTFSSEFKTIKFKGVSFESTM